MNNYYKKSLILCIILFENYTIASTTAIDHHVICSLQKTPKNKQKLSKCNHLIHQATYEIKQQCKTKYKNSIDTNDHYAHRRDTVFFIHFDHEFHTWTLYKPSFIPYDEFVTLIKKIYAQHGLQITCHRDQLVTVTKTDVGFDNNYLSLDEFEKYKNMPDSELLSQIDSLQNNKDDDAQELAKLKNIKDMKKYFFWHLQIPTTGLLPGNEFDIEDQYKPLAWHFLLWDLAPKKGQGAHVAIIDTGISAFNIHDKEFTDVYKKNINITMSDVLQNYGYNLVSKNGLDPIRQVAINFGHYCDHAKFDSNELIKKLPVWIIDFIKNKETFQIKKYFINNAKKEYLDTKKSSLNEKGEKALKDLLYGKYGITPSEKDSFFHVVKLDKPYDEDVLLETLPTPKTIGNKDPFSAGHGTFTQGVVSAQLYNEHGISGLAPQAHVTMIKAFNDKGTTNKTTLNAALQRAITLKNPIVSMSLKITDEIDTVADAPLKKLIDSIDYVVAASGNDGNSKKLHLKEAYPAKFDSVAFDVGAFQYNQGKYNVCSFTQKEPNIGPKFVAPGFDIFSSGLTPDQTTSSMYLFMAGTSIAVPVITGFLALVLAEFQDDFTREQILKVIYKFSIKLSDDDDWQQYIKLGTPDMRSVLLCLHTLRSLHHDLEDNFKYSFADNFDNLVEAIYTINYYVPACYEKLLGVSLTHNFSGFVDKIHEKAPRQLDIKSYTPITDNLSECVDFIAQPILTAINSKKYPKKFDCNQELLTSLQTIISAKNFNLFAKLSSSSQTRIKGALASRSSRAIS
ncbi:MAG: S8 family serine peptidase [Candidatus Chromulinivorax sp.]|nr:S8 family serine peptidase [Candidatus Chromulinivorax sp.]